jgi:hypothetical protein
VKSHFSLLILRRQVGGAVPAFFGRYQDNTRNHDNDGADKHAECRLIAPDQVAVDYGDDNADVFERADEGKLAQATAHN